MPFYSELWFALGSLLVAPQEPAVPTVVIAYGFVIPGSCIAGFNGLTFGFGTTVLGACMSYVAGVRAALRG